MSTFLLFVYGTLKRGGCRHGPLVSQRYLGEAATAAQYTLYHLGDYPGLVAGNDVVHGELYEVDLALLPWLDDVEGAPDWFKLEPIEMAGHTNVQAYFYQGDVRDRPRIVLGWWENAP